MMLSQIITLILLACLISVGCADSEEGQTASLNPDFPVVSGIHQITPDWTVTLPSQFNRRHEASGDIVLWKPGFTIWIVAWNNDHNETREERLAWLTNGTTPEAYDKETEVDGNVTRYAYRLAEASEDERQAAFYCFAIGEKSHIQMAIYFDREEDVNEAKRIWRSLQETPASNINTTSNKPKIM